MFYAYYHMRKGKILMRTSLDIPESLLDEAREAAGTKTKTQAIILALSEFIQRRKGRRLLELKGSLRGSYDYKTLRRKR